MNKNEQILEDELDRALKSGRTFMVVAYIESTDLSRYWRAKFEDKKNTFVWKLDNTKIDGKDWAMGLCHVWRNVKTTRRGSIPRPSNPKT